MLSITKPIDNIFHAAWKIATLQYAYELLMSNPVQFAIFSPIVVPVSTVLAVLTIYIALGVVMTVCGLLALMVVSLSGPFITIALILILCSSLYQAGLTAVNYLSHQPRITYSQCKDVMLERIQAATHIVIRVRIPDYISSIPNRAVNKITDMYRQVSHI